MLNKINQIQTISGRFIILQITRSDYYNQNTFIVFDQEQKTQMIIDPGADPDSIAEALNKYQGKTAAVLLTHGHFDHIASAHHLSQIYEIPCFVHKSDFRLLKQSPNYALLFEKKTIKAPLNIESIDNITSFFPIQVLHTPGHTEGSCCFFLEDIIFTGDTLLPREAGRTDLPGGSASKMEESLIKLYALCSHNTIICPGHGEILKFTAFNSI